MPRVSTLPKLPIEYFFCRKAEMLEEKGGSTSTEAKPLIRESKKIMQGIQNTKQTPKKKCALPLCPIEYAAQGRKKALRAGGVGHINFQLENIYSPCDKLKVPNVLDRKASLALNVHLHEPKKKRSDELCHAPSMHGEQGASLAHAHAFLLLSAAQA